MSKLEDYTIGIGALGTVYLGRLNKKGTEWVGEKKDITNEFISCTLTKYGPSNVTEISQNGKVTHNVILVPVNKNVMVANKIVCGPDYIDVDSSIKSAKLSDFAEISSTTLLVLEKSEITLVSQVVQFTRSEFVRLEKVDMKVLVEIENFLETKNLSLKTLSK